MGSELRLQLGLHVVGVMVMHSSHGIRVAATVTLTLLIAAMVTVLDSHHYKFTSGASIGEEGVGLRVQFR